eukprot:gb/GECH01003515.1/.p1 GENE.gb/GECH01003515.1/~~gb/GECH01003515.1/.p1  ORF type:complete len:152 (+),score=58.33 gb/GECH01003515.1/:1-456(+)
MSQQPDLTDEQVKEFRQAFDLFDKNGDGRISSSELRKVMESIGLNPKTEELNDMIKEVDIDGNGMIEFQEFLVLMSRKLKSSDSEEEIREAFRMFDKNKDGFISEEELKQVMRAIGEELSDEQITEMIKEADSNGDGQIDFDEFLRMMRSQ